MALEDQIIGQGWSFPPEFDLASGQVKMTTGVEDIHNSLQILFTTTLGERVMQPRYGCSLESMIMEPMNAGTLGYIRNLLETAILYHEARIDAEKIKLEVDAEAGMLRIEVSYTIRGTNSRFNFVYPFYLQEGQAL